MRDTVEITNPTSIILVDENAKWRTYIAPNGVRFSASRNDRHTYQLDDLESLHSVVIIKHKSGTWYLIAAITKKDNAEWEQMREQQYEGNLKEALRKVFDKFDKK